MRIYTYIYMYIYIYIYILETRHGRDDASTSLQILRSKLVDMPIVGAVVGSNIEPASRAGTEVWSKQARSRMARVACRAGRTSWHDGVSRQARSGLAREAVRAGRASWHDRLVELAGRAGTIRWSASELADRTGATACRAGRASWLHRGRQTRECKLVAGSS